MKGSLDIIQFTPIVGGETTLTMAMGKLLTELGYSVRIIHPSKSGKMLKGWCTMENQHFVKISEFPEFIKNTNILFFINSIHLKKYKKLEQREVAFKSIESIFNFSNKKVIFYEHGRHSAELYDYPKIFKILKNKGNKVIVFTNTNEVIPYYENLEIPSFLIRQPFFPEYYPERKKPISEKIQICFNSRYTSNKRPQYILPYFKEFLDSDYDFQLNFRGNVRDNVSVWFNLFEYFESDKIVMHEYFEKFHEIYDYQNYCIYGGYTTKSEKGKMEYSILESFYYEIPLIVENEVIQTFRYDEYGISKEQFLKSVIPLSENNLKLILSKEFDYTTYVENAKKLVDDFLPEIVKERLNIGLSGFDNVIKIKKPDPLF